MSLRRVGWLSVCVCLLAIQVVSAQQPGQDGGRRRGPGGPGGFGGGFGGGPGGGGGELMLLGNEQIQKELELIPDQIADFEKLREEAGTKMRSMFEGMRELSEDERRAKFDELRPKMEEAQKELQGKMKEILLPHQADRLKEIFVQVRGAGALDDAEIAAKLKITDEQKKQMQDVREAQRGKMQELFQNREGSEEERRAKFQAAMQEVSDKVLAVLSSEQRDQFEKMKGEKLELDLSQLRRGGPGGPGGPGGFRGRGPGGDRPNGDRPQGQPPEGDRPKNET